MRLRGAYVDKVYSPHRWLHHVLKHLLQDIMESEEEHLDWLETQFELIGKVSG